jgi:hypothetical protein
MLKKPHRHLCRRPSDDVAGPLNDPKSLNKELPELFDELDKLYKADHMDGFLLYL